MNSFITFSFLACMYMICPGIEVDDDFVKHQQQSSEGRDGKRLFGPNKIEEQLWYLIVEI